MARQFLRSIILNTCGVMGQHKREELADARWPWADPKAITKAALGAMTADPTTTRFASEFFNTARQRSVLGRLEFLQTAFDVRMLHWTAGAMARWVREGQALPITKPALVGSKLPTRRVGAISLATKESVMAWANVVETALEQELLGAIADAIDAALLGSQADGGETPEGLLHPGPHLVSQTATGDLGDTLQAAIEAFQGDARRAALIMSPGLALRIATTLPAALDLGPNGGTLFGMPVAATSALPADSDGDQLVLIDPASIATAFSGGDVSISDKASVQADDEPTNNSVTPTATQVISLFQTGTVGFLATTYANWKPLATACVVHVSGINDLRGS